MANLWTLPISNSGFPRIEESTWNKWVKRDYKLFDENVWLWHPCSLISAFVVHYLDSIVPILAKSKIARLASLCSWADWFEFYLAWKSRRQVFSDMTYFVPCRSSCERTTTVTLRWCAWNSRTCCGRRKNTCVSTNNRCCSSIAAVPQPSRSKLR